MSSNIEQTMAIVRYTRGLPKFIWGPPGIGKSAAIHQICREDGIGLIDVRLSQLDPTDIRGLPIVNREKNEASWATPDFLPQVARDGANGILFLDELNSAPPMVQAAAYQLTLDRRVGNYRLPDGWDIVAAGNRIGDRGVVFRMPSPLANRFVHVEMEADLEMWRKWAFSASIDSRLIAFLQFKGSGALFSFNPESEETAFATPRTWEYVHKVLNSQAVLNSREALHDNVNALTAMSGCVGTGMALEFIKYVELTNELPDIMTVLNNGKILPPKKISLRHAVIAGLTSALVQAKKHDPNKLPLYLANAVEYMGHKEFEAEFATLFIKDIANTDVKFDIAKHPAYIDWVRANKQLLL
jgi:hypothetical protein